MERKELVEIGFYESRIEAEFAQSVLRQNGIESVLKGDDPYAVPGSGMGDFELLVSAADEDKAAEILDSIGGAEAEQAGLPEPFDRRSSAPAAAFVAALILIAGAAVTFYIVSGTLGDSTRKAVNVPGTPSRNPADDTIFQVAEDNVLAKPLIEKDEIVETDLDDDGYPETRTEFRQGVPFRSEIIEKGATLPRTVIEYKNGIRSRELLDVDGDGRLETKVTYDRYGCFQGVGKAD